ncbi:MAG: DUF4062 domain-containing protein [Christensenellaceae bacterium]|nr:DUF4062 domain-containing protein [Christensenellaceae bacterium]
MPTDAKIVKVFIASPGDLGDERIKLKSAVNELKSIQGFRFESVIWEEDIPTTALYGMEPQKYIDTYLVGCDMAIVMFKGRFGSPTNDFSSGTEEEFYTALSKKMPVIVYFFKHQIDSKASVEETEQFVAVKRFKEKIRTMVFSHDVASFDDILKRLDIDMPANIKKIGTITVGTAESQSSQGSASNASNKLKKYEGRWLQIIFDFPERPVGICKLSFNEDNNSFEFQGHNYHYKNRGQDVYFESDIVIESAEQRDAFYYISHPTLLENTTGFGKISFLRKKQDEFTIAEGYFIDVTNSGTGVSKINRTIMIKCDKAFFNHIKLKSNTRVKDITIIKYAKDYLKEDYNIEVNL